jgi:signal transduction histidine kinase
LPGWLARLRAAPLGARIALVLVAALVLSHAVAFLAYREYAAGERVRAEAGRLGPAMAAAWRAAEAAIARGETPPSTRDERLIVAWRPAGAPAGLAGAARSEVRLPASLAPAPRVLVALERPTTTPRVSIGEAETLGEAFAALSRALAAEGVPARVEIALSDGSWLELASPATWRRGMTPVELALIVIAAVAIAGVAAAALGRRLARPVERLAALGEHVDPMARRARLPESGPDEVRRLAHAMNQTRDVLNEMIAERTRLLAAISHDLRAPATRLRLRAEFVTDEALREKLFADIDEMSGMIAAALDFLSGESLREEPETMAFASVLQSLCDDYAGLGRPVAYEPPPPLAFETVRTVFGSAHATVSFDGARPLLLHGRPQSLRRAFANLIDNALKYGGRAAVRVSATAEAVAVEIDDDGPGIPEAELANVFKPFYRLARPGDVNGRPGVGLGLAIVKAVVDAHRGTIELRNRSHGGLSVRVTLPRAV